MIKKQKWVFFLAGVLTLFTFASSIVLFNHTANAYAPTNGKCENGSTPASGSNGTPADCAENTRSTQQAAPGQQTGGQGQQQPEKGETCAVEKIGWMLCPIMEGAGKASDAVFNFLAGRFLETEPELLNNNSGTKDAWEQARNLANVMFIIAFIVIVYSQVTGAGLNNYGIKRMLPRLILAAIAVNVSFYICQGMADLSNLLGYNIKDGLSAISNNLGPTVFGTNNQGTNTQGTTVGGGILTSIIAVGLAGAGIAIWGFVGIAAAIVPIVLIIGLSVIVILLLRKAFIVLLVVVSPIAFVMYLLPNTEKLFSKWLSMFWKLLLVFPIVALLMGGGELASTIILASSAGANNSTTGNSAPANCDQNAAAKERAKDPDGADYNMFPCADKIAVTNNDNTKPGSASIGTGLIATGIAVAPLLAVWSVLQGALAAAGAIGGKIGSAVQKGTQRGVGGAGKFAGEKYKNSSLGKMRAREKRIREGQIRSGAYKGKNPVRRTRSAMNNRLNNLGYTTDENGKMKRSDGIIGRYAAQRGRDALSDRSSRAREKAEEFAGAGTYEEEFQNGLKQFHTAKNQNERDEGLLYMNAAMLAASRLDDRSALDKMRPLTQDAQNMDKTLRSAGRSSGPTGSSTPSYDHTPAPVTVRPNVNVNGAGGSGASATGFSGDTTTSEQNRLNFAQQQSDGSMARPVKGSNLHEQIKNAGGYDQLSTSELLAVHDHATNKINSPAADHVQASAHDELASRGVLPPRK